MNGSLARRCRSLAWLASCGLLLLLLGALPASAGRWRPIGPWGGALADLVVDRFVPNRLFALLGLRGSGINPALYLSEDAGESWRLVNPEMPSARIERVVAVPPPRFFPNLHRLYAFGGGLWRSVDLGRTWVQVLGEPGRQIVDFVVYPEDDFPLVVLDAAAGPIVSNDGGETWLPRRQGLPEGATFARLVVAPDDFERLFLASSVGVFRSLDNGLTWMHTNLQEPVNRLVSAPGGGLYAFRAGSGALWRTTDEGASWQPIAFQDRFREIHALRPHHALPRVLLALTEAGLFESSNLGGRWDTVSTTVLGSSSQPSASLLVVDPVEPARLWVGLGSLPVVKSEDGGLSWRIANQGLSHQTIHDMALTPAAPAMVQVIARLPGSQATTLWKTRDGGGHWRVRQPSGLLRHTSLAIKPNEFPFTLTGTTRFDGAPSPPLARTADGGESWVDLEAVDLSESPDQLVFDPVRPRRVYARVFDRVAVSDDGGLTWSSGRNGLPEACDRLTCSDPFPRELEVSSTLRNTLYFLNNDRLHRSRDGGASWQEIYRAPAGFPLLDDLALDPRDPNRLYLGTDVGVYASRDGGRTFLPRNLGLPTGESDHPLAVRSIVADPHRSGHLLALVADNRVYRSRNAGQRWKPDPNGLPPGVGPLRLVAHPVLPGRFLALTAFGGVWEADLAD